MNKKIYKITCPTQDTFRDLSKFSFLKDKLIILKDPIIKCSKIQKSKSKNVLLPRNIDKIVSKNDFFYPLVDLRNKRILFFI